MKRRLGRCLVIGLLATIMLFFPLLASPHRIDEAHRNLIREGMTAAEVESIFGVPAGTYDWAVVDGPSDTRLLYSRLFERYLERQFLARAREQQTLEIPVVAVVDTPRKRWAFGDKVQSWTSRHGSVAIGFDENGLVCWVSDWLKVRVEPPWKKWWDKIRGK
jgi:hypothetical protein